MPALGLKLRLSSITSLIASVFTTGMQMWHKFTATTWSGSNRLPDSSPVGTNTAALYTGRGLSFDGVNDLISIGNTGKTVKSVVFYGYADTLSEKIMQLQALGAVEIGISMSVTNLLLQSEDFSTTWIKLGSPNVSIDTNTQAAPNGEMTADVMTSNSTNNGGVRQTVTVVDATQYTFSVWVKSNVNTNFIIDIQDKSPAYSGTATSNWQRVSVTATVTGTSGWVDIVFASPSVGSVLYLWGAQLETGGTANQYVATTTSSLSGAMLTTAGWTSPTTYVNAVNGKGISASIWYHIAVTSATGISASSVLLGRSNTTYFAGDLCNVKMFSAELTKEQIIELYNNPEQVIPTGISDSDLAAWWNLSENDVNIIQLDGSGGNNHGSNAGATTIVKLPQPVNQNALIGGHQSFYFNASNTFIGCGGSMPLTDTFTINFWIIPITGGRCINYKHNSGGANPIFAIQISDASGGIFSVSNGAEEIGYASAGISLFKFYHFAITKDSSRNVTFYKNGVSLGTKTFSTWSSGTTPVFEIGRWSTSYIRAIINAVSFHDSVLTSSEIADIYAGGLSFDLTSNSSNYISSTNLKGWWKNYGSTNADWTDRSGNGNNGTVNGSINTVFIPEGLNNENIFGGTFKNHNNGHLIYYGNGYAQIADAASLDITSAITLEAWVKPFTVSALQSAIGKNSAYALNITSGAKLQFQRWSGAASGTVSSTASLLANTWYHIAATYNGTTTVLYVNGVQDTSSGAITGSIDATATDVLMGALTSSTNLFSGYLDSVKVYSQVLTAAQILGNYNAEKSSYQ